MRRTTILAGITALALLITVALSTVIVRDALATAIPSNGVITSGGTYTGTITNTNNSKAAAVEIATSQPVVIDGAEIESATDDIRVTADNADLTVRNSELRQLHPGVAGRLPGYALLIPDTGSAGRLVFEHNLIAGETNSDPSNGGILLRGWQNGQSDETMKIRYNKMLNCNGMTSTASGWSNTTKVNLQHRFSGNNRIQNVPGFEVGWNVIENDYLSSSCEDHISVFNSGGTASDDYEIHHNLIDGMYAAGPNSSAYSGGGIITDGSATATSSETDRYLNIHDNVTIDSMNYGQKITQGHHNKLVNNVSVRDGLASDGSNYLDDASLLTGGAIALQQKKAEQEEFFGAHTVTGNQAGHAGGQEFNLDPGDCNPACTVSNNTTIAESTTSENAERAEYYSEATAAGVTFGVDASPPSDTTAPQTTIDSGPSGSTTNNDPQWTFSGTDNVGVDHFECRIDSGLWASCTSPQGYTDLASGSHTFEVRAVDAASNVDATPASATINVTTADTTDPETTIDSGPSGDTPNGDATFAFSSNEANSTFSCRIDSGTYADCQSPITYSGLSDGSHTFDVFATDAASNADDTPASRTFDVDTQAPETTIDSGPTEGSTDTDGDVSFSFSSEAGASFECRMDTEAFASCSSPKSYNDLSAGTHTFEVRASDAVGNADSSPAARSFNVSASPGGTSESIEAEAMSESLSAITQVQDSGANPVGQTNATRHTGIGFMSAASPADGDEVVVRARGTLESGGYPDVRLKIGGTEVTGSPANVGSASYADYNFNVSVSETQTIEIAGTDMNSGARPLYVDKVTINSSGGGSDTTAPDTTITDGPTGLVSNNDLSWGFSGSDDVGIDHFECRIDSGSYSTCTSPKSYADLSDGSHTFEVRAVDAASNVDATPASVSVNVDTTAPSAPSITDGPADSSTDTDGDFSFTFSGEAAADFECSLDTGATDYSTCFSPAEYVDQQNGFYTFRVKQTDAAGNVSPAATRAFTVNVTPSGTTFEAESMSESLNAITQVSDEGANPTCAVNATEHTGVGFMSISSPASGTQVVVRAHGTFESSDYPELRLRVNGTEVSGSPVEVGSEIYADYTFGVSVASSDTIEIGGTNLNSGARPLYIDQITVQ